MCESTLGLLLLTLAHLIRRGGDDNYRRGGGAAPPAVTVTERIRSAVGTHREDVYQLMVVCGTIAVGIGLGVPWGGTVVCLVGVGAVSYFVPASTRMVRVDYRRGIWLLAGGGDRTTAIWTGSVCLLCAFVY